MYSYSFLFVITISSLALLVWSTECESSYTDETLLCELNSFSLNNTGYGGFITDMTTDNYNLYMCTADGNVYSVFINGTLHWT